MRALRKWMLLLALAFAPLPAAAQTCGGFTDVSPTDGFCNNIEWIANRLVTTGCSLVPLEYCPNRFVLRGEMGAFMNRLGTALTPLILRAAQVLPTQQAYNPFLIACATPQDDGVPGGVEGVPAANHPRQASFTATVMNFNSTTSKTVQGQLVYSTDNGGTWNSTGDFIMWQTVDPTERTTLALTGGPFNLAVAQLYRFALRLTTNDFLALVDGECQLNARIDNRNPLPPDAPPF